MTHSLLEFATIDVILPTLETERLVLRPLTVDDEAAMFAYASDPEVARHTSWTPHTSLDDRRAFLERVMANYAERKPASWGVVEQTLGQLIGTCGFVSVDLDGLTGHLGYAYARSFWGQGYGTEAARAAMACGFTDLGFVRIAARCTADNHGSARILHKLGMVLVGTAPYFDAREIAGGRCCTSRSTVINGNQALADTQGANMPPYRLAATQHVGAGG